MDRSILGSRIRQRRREIGLTQVELARRVGISPSYLNLIEWNKRQIAGTLLRKIARALNLELDDLEGAAERRLLEILTEIAHFPSLETLGIEGERIGEFIGRFPGWAKAVATLSHAEREAAAHVQSLSDRLSNDPFLGETVHRMLTRIAAIRSAADILTAYSDVPPERRDRFHEIIHEESRSLSDVGEALAAYLDKSAEPTRTLTPLDEVEAMFSARNYHFAEIETETASWSSHLTDLRPISRRESAYNLASSRLAGLIDDIINAHPQIETEAARGRARRALLTYAAGAIMMPMAAFQARCSELQYDVETLAGIFSTEFDSTCRRLTALPPGPKTPQFGYYRANAAGSIVEMLRLEGIVIPRYAPACPLWVLYRAQQSPEAAIRQRALFPSGARFVFVARAGNTGMSGFGKARHYITDMIAMSETDSQYTIYAPDPMVSYEEVGPSCRLCPRRNCTHRFEDPLAA